MKKNPKVWYYITIYDVQMSYIPSLRKWIDDDLILDVNSSNFCRTKTMSGALKMCSKIDYNSPKSAKIEISQYTYKHGKRMVMDYTYKRRNK